MLEHWTHLLEGREFKSYFYHIFSRASTTQIIIVLSLKLRRTKNKTSLTTKPNLAGKSPSWGPKEK